MLSPAHAAWALFALFATLTAALSTSSTILVLSRDSASATSGTSGLRGYGIPYEVVIVPQAGIVLPTLNSSATEGNYGGFIILSELAYEYETGWRSALTDTQWEALYAYQSSFGVRMVRLDVYPGPAFGATTAVAGTGCCGTGVQQTVSISDSSDFPTANLKVGAGVSMSGLWRYPATITDSTIAKAVAVLSPDSAGTFTTETVAAIINDFGTRQQMVWFTSWATEWSTASNFLQHVFIHWVTRGLFVGRRKTYLSTQVDDMHLETPLYLPSGTTFRVRTSDLNAHKTWQDGINSRLPAGSNYFIEIGHNGNGNIEFAVRNPASEGVCTPDEAVSWDGPDATALEFQKPLGTGTDVWPPEFTEYTWSLACARLDSIGAWFNDNPSAFAAVSHTFSHLSLNNATYSDVNKESYFNIAWLQQIGLWTSNKFSPEGLIPPAITGLRNGDAIQAWNDNGIHYVVGDNTRPSLRNPTSPFWPLISTVAANGRAGLTIIPRWATTIYYNCDTQECTLQEWINTSGGSGTFSNLLDDARAVNTRHLLGLHTDPFMFHQANMRTGDVNSITIGSQSGTLSLLQIWVETITQEMARLTNWPIITLKHDDIGRMYVRRMTLDNCNPRLRYNLSNDGSSIVSVTVMTNGNTCGTPVPVTVPGSVSGSSGTISADQVGSEPTIYWTTLQGSAVTLTLSHPVPV